MRTTVELPPELFRAAKARSAERGESLKTLIARALAAEVAMPNQRRSGARVRLPLIPDSGGPKVRLTNADIEGHLAGADAERASLAPRRRPERLRR